MNRVEKNLLAALAVRRIRRHRDGLVPNWAARRCASPGRTSIAGAHHTSACAVPGNVAYADMPAVLIALIEFSAALSESVAKVSA